MPYSLTSHNDTSIQISSTRNLEKTNEKSNNKKLTNEKSNNKQ